MAKIIAPVAGYTGVSASVQFEKGVGHTDDPHLIEWFEKKGYEIESEDLAKEKKMTAAEKKAAAREAEKKTAEEEAIKADLTARAEELKLDLPEGLTIDQVKEMVEAAEKGAEQNES